MSASPHCTICNLPVDGARFTDHVSGATLHPMCFAKSAGLIAAPARRIAAHTPRRQERVALQQAA